MTKLFKKGAVVVSMLAVFSILTASIPIQAAQAYTVRIKNHSSSVSALKVCHDWGSSSCYSGIAYLQAGQWSPSSWSDTDGYYIPGDQKVTQTKLGIGTTYSGPLWHKVSDCGGCDVVVRLYWK